MTEIIKLKQAVEYGTVITGDIIDVVESKEPPRHLLLGKAAYEGAYGKIEALKGDFKAWKDTTLGADYE